jgi:glycosyltransferase involved in cell wall biosynthesis
MERHVDVAVIISTWNRCDELHGTLEAVLSQDADPCSYEVIIADNNSTDGTRDVVESFIARGHRNLRYVFEPQPGVSHGRNTAIRATRAAILAFTDDDVLVARSWVANIKRAFDSNPHVDYVTGKMLPIFEAEPPSWMAGDNTGPCVLRNRGDQPLYSQPGCFFPGWATANIAFRRTVFDRIGLFAGDFPRGQDLELIVRLWRANGRGMYAPDVVVSHHIPLERMTKKYHRMWHTREGDIRSRIRLREIFDSAGRVMGETPGSPRLFGVPAFLYRELMGECAGWLVAALRRDESRAFRFEGKVRQTVSYMRTRFREYAREQRRSRVAEILRFAKSLTFRKWRTLGSRAAPRTDEMPRAEGEYQELEQHQLTGSPRFRRSG